ncbi:M20/M25/M40 family metallo-hydrolase [Pontibacter silvestris]|uniref:M20/M25/M40 family metallo-hydrolase n=1 Tax=Pontibacter silvestris TaxID=2305183 RepID=A0ABW4WZZ3_9BACT|nr:M20/M25/M40 family metallo-hydrolase [Pontibacter silvestris]MCC9135494.1 M20/M25/M40 family metallo-hydrolase [Pontibacter silvestris]
MKKRKLAVAALALIFGTNTFAQNLSAISQQETSRIIKTLSADDMQGRSAFTPGVDKAADFIAGEFKKTGLKPLPEENNFKQTFSVYRFTPQEKEVHLNGQTVSADNVFAVTNYEELEWDKDINVATEVIKESDNFRAAISRINSLEQNVLALVHPKHTDTFKAYQRYLTRGGIQQKKNEGNSKVFVLTDQTVATDYKIEIENQAEQLPLTNIAGMIEGKRKDEIVVFSGHYDHIGILTAVDGDSIANGADDDASGTTAMIMLAKYYKKQPKPDRTLIFVAFTAEEIGGYGSRYFSEQLPPDQIVAMFNIEMVGKPSKFGPNTAYLTGFEKSNLGELMQKHLQGTTYSIHPDPYPEQNLFYRSDNATLARLGVPAHTISSVQIDQDKSYHSVNDEIEQLDMAHMTNMIKAIALASRGIVYGNDTPTRVDKSTVRQ